MGAKRGDGERKIMKVYVYTRPVNEENYPEGLARSVHFAWEGKDGEKEALNRNYGILFAKGAVTEDNMILPKGVKNPGIFDLGGGLIGILAERVLENGEADDASGGKMLLWKTEDLIHFSEEETLDRVEASDCLEVDDSIVRKAREYWNPVVFTGVSVPDDAVIGSEEELDRIKARILYSDGSEREKKVCWDKSGISFDREGGYEITGRIAQQRFRFPLSKGYGDPVIFPWEGKWYFISTNDNLNDIGLYVREADDVQGLFVNGITEHLILGFDPERKLEQTFWAPEFHVIGDELYILFAVSGHEWGPQCHMMKLKKGCALTLPESWEDPVRVLRRDGSPLATAGITLDMTYLKVKSGSYVIWSYRENCMKPFDTGSMLYIASIDEKRPWELISEPALLTRPLYGWENVSGTINNEGPYAFVKDGKVYVTYSGGAANGYTYALGLLCADEDKDLTQVSYWEKNVEPVLTFYSVEGVFGPGHNSFFRNEEDELMIAYHGETDIKSNLRCDGIHRVHFRKDGTPYFQMSPADDVPDCEVRIRVKVTRKTE